MKKSSEPSSFLDEESQKSQVKIQKQQNQFKALFLKNVRLQSKQKGTNCCQIITPIICLIFTYLIKTIASDGLKVNVEYQDNMYPYKFNDFTQYDQINSYTQPIRPSYIQYYMYECTESCNDALLGRKDGSHPNISQSGMLGNVGNSSLVTPIFRPNPYFDINNTITKISPFFEKAELNKQIYNRLNTIGQNSISYIKNSSGLDYLPDGGFKFTHLDQQSFRADIKINDCRDLDYHRTNGLTKNKQIKKYTVNNVKAKMNDTQFTQAYGLLHMIHVATSSFIQTFTKQAEKIQAGFLLMPQNQNTFVDTIINSISALVYPLGLSLLFPVFLYSIVLEKQERLVQMMKMNGLKITNYWLTFFVFNLLLCVITNLIFYLVGIIILDTSFFTKTSKLLLFIVSFGWSLAQIGMAAFFQTFLSKSRSANIIGYLFSIWTTMIGATLNLGSYQYPAELPIGLQIIPPFAFVRSFYLMMMECSKGDCFYDMGLLTTEIKQCISFLYLGFVIFFLLGIYLFEVIPQEFGVRRSPLFPIYAMLNLFKKRNTVSINTSQDPDLRAYISQHQEDDFSKRQRQKVLRFAAQENQQAIKEQYPLIINNMRKLYKKEGVEGFYPAVRSLNLAIAKKETFGLLGPNGAGKTTLISMITGMYEPNFGNAWIGGYDIQTNIEKAQLQMGVCPQFDLVWPQLSVEQHLYFYARLKGIPQKLIKTQVQASIRQVKLQKFSKFAATQLSGGMRRRLSVAISLVGDPKIVFLDEPSTGLDPQNRRQLWSVLAECQTKRALFITTHMMQEADTLCNRVGIITNGVLRTIQTPIKLKKTYGEGYDVIINTLKQQRQLISQQSLHLGLEEERWHNEQIKVRQSIGTFIDQQISKTYKLNQVSRKIAQFMKKQFPGTYLFKHFNGYLIFKVPSNYKISTLFQTMNLVQKDFGFSDIAISNSSLQDVFMNVVQKFDSDEKKFYPHNSQQIEGLNNQRQNDNQDNQMNIAPHDTINNSSGKFKQGSSEEDKHQKGRQHLDSVISKKRESVISQHDGKPRNSSEALHQEQQESDKRQQRIDGELKDSKASSNSSYF